MSVHIGAQSETMKKIL